MKRLITVVWFLVLGLITPAAHGLQQSTAARAASAAPSKIDPAKEADIRRLLELTGAKAITVQMMDRMSENIKPLMTNALPPGDYREKLIDLFFAKLQSRMDLQQLLDKAIPIYDQQFSQEEIKGLIKFYETPLGQKAISALPKITGEMSQAGNEWGQALGQQCMRDVLAEHPDLAQALEVAAKKQQQ